MLMSMIKVSNLYFNYESHPDYIFNNVSFIIDTDWKLGFIGRNGKGNTTLLNSAFDSILAKIELAGIGNVEILDGTTNHVATTSGVSHLLDVDTSSFKYYRNGVEWPKTEAPAATFNPTTGEVTWDLSSVGVLYKSFL